MAKDGDASVAIFQLGLCIKIVQTNSTLLAFRPTWPNHHCLLQYPCKMTLTCVALLRDRPATLSLMRGRYKLNGPG